MKTTAKTRTGLLRFIKVMIRTMLGLESELEPNSKIGFCNAIVEDIINKLGDLVSNSDSVGFYTDDSTAGNFLNSIEGHNLLSSQLTSKNLAELLPLAEGISCGQVFVRPLSEAPKDTEVRSVNNLDLPVLYKLFTQTCNTDCKITIEGQEPFYLSEKKSINGIYPFGREDKEKPLRTNSFTLPSDWKNVSRAQGIIYPKKGRWFIKGQNRPKMNINGEPLDIGIGNEKELAGSGTIEIGTTLFKYSIESK